MNKLLTLLFLSSCTSESTFNSKTNIDKFGTPVKIEYYKHLQGKTFQFSDTANFIITGNQELKTAIAEIACAKNPEPWKGAGWDRIEIYFTDTVVKINTDGRKIGLGASGTFYSLDNDNFISKHMK
jgi:hypothetical protein